MISRCPFKRIDGQAANEKHDSKQNKPNGEWGMWVSPCCVHKAALNERSQQRAKNDNRESDMANGYRNQPTSDLSLHFASPDG